MRVLYNRQPNICSERRISVKRVILHSDLNACFASIECMLDPSLKGKPVAVGGSVEMRHGIILAKSQEAKVCGVKTGEALWQAKQKCPDLIIVPPHYEQYVKYSHLAHDIYLRYTNLVEPFGLDECWLDVTENTKFFCSGLEIAEEIRAAMKRELGLTVSIGVSFNKIFAKLGSDMKKPDAITCIGYDEYKEKVWPLPCSDLLGVGRATTKKLESRGIITIGDIAKSERDYLRRFLGVCGEELWVFANGLDCSRVKNYEYTVPAKSVGHGITCSSDLVSSDEVWKVMLELSQNVSKRLKAAKLSACAVQIGIRDNQLSTVQFQAPVPIATQSAIEIAKAGIELFNKNYKWNCDIRSVTVRAIDLQPEDSPCQLDLFCDRKKHERQEKIDNTVMNIRRRFGEKSIFNCCLIDESKIPHHKPDHVTLPSPMFK